MTKHTAAPRLARGATIAAPSWTPKIVGEQLVEAMRWAAAQGPVGPRGFNHIVSGVPITL